MTKLVLLSICIALIVVPLWVSTDPHPARGLKRALFGVVAFNLLYVFILRVVVPRLG